MTREPEFLISWQNLENLIDEGNSFESPVGIAPQSSIVFDGIKTELSLEILSNEGALPSHLPQELIFRVKTQADKKFLVLSCLDRELFRAFYDFVSEVLAVAVEENQPPNKAVDIAWEKWGRLLERQSVLSKEKQIGLIGELWSLCRIAKSLGWRTALDSWHQEANSEHDFCFAEIDMEVKTTASEARIHMISSLSQLEPTAGRGLLLLSLQLTPSPQHARGVFSLATMVGSVGQALKESSVNDERFERRLAKAGWKQSHSRFYTANYLMRAVPKLINVDDSCPRLTTPILVGVNSERVTSVSYRIDVSGLGFEDGSEEFLKVLPAQ